MRHTKIKRRNDDANRRSGLRAKNSALLSFCFFFFGLGPGIKCLNRWPLITLTSFLNFSVPNTSPGTVKLLAEGSSNR